MESHSSAVPEAATGRGLRIALWSAQIILAIVFALAGGMKAFTPAAEVAGTAYGLPLAFFRFIGIVELAASVGLILPAVTRIAPVLTPLAAAGLVVVMVGAAVLHIGRGEFASAVLVVVLGGLAYLVAWGRFKRAPIAPRSRPGMARLHVDEGRQW